MPKSDGDGVSARPQCMFGQDVDAAGPGSDAVNGGVQEQMGLVARRQLVRVSGPVDLLRRVSAQGKTRAVSMSIRLRLHQQTGEPQPTQLTAMSGLLGPRVSDAESVQIASEDADPGGARTVGVGLGRTGAEPFGVGEFGR